MRESLSQLPVSPPPPPLRVPGEHGSLVLYLMVPTVVFFLYVYSFAFNYLPDDVRLLMAGALSVCHAFLAFYALVGHAQVGSFIILLSACITIAAWSVGIVFGEGRFDLKLMSRDLTHHLSAIWILGLSLALPRRFLSYLCVLSILGGGILAFVLDPIEVGFIKRLGPFLGGTEGLHSSATFIVLNMILVDLLGRQRIIPPIVTWPILAFGAAVLVGYQVRTTFVILGVYVISSVYYRYRAYHVAKLIPLAVVGGLIVFGLGLAGTGDAEIALLGSGRIGNYLHRIDLLGMREPFMFVFGSGAGSDSFTTTIYWWEAKGAHNDFLHLFIEQGFFGLAGFLLLLLGLNRMLPRHGNAILWAIVAASVISIGPLARPTISVFAFLAMGIVAQAHRAGTLEASSHHPGPRSDAAPNADLSDHRSRRNL